MELGNLQIFTSIICIQFQAGGTMRGQPLAAASFPESVFGLGLGLGRPLWVLLILVAFAGRTVKMDGMMVPRAADK